MFLNSSEVLQLWSLEKASDVADFSRKWQRQERFADSGKASFGESRDEKRSRSGFPQGSEGYKSGIPIPHVPRIM
jgi:hypothetical protein